MRSTSGSVGAGAADHSAGPEPVAEPTPAPVGDSRDIGGDPACWLDRVCTECGRFIEDEFAETCPRCGTPREFAR